MLVSPFRHTARVLCTALLAGLPALSWGASDSELRDALAAAREQQWARVDERAIEDHPLRGYVEYHRIRGQLPHVSPDRVQQFIDQYADSPLAGWIRGQAIAKYGHAGRYSDLLAVADGEPAGTARQCHYYTALLASQPQVASEAGLDLWRVGSSQPDACDPLFERLRANGTIDATAIWERKMLAWQAGETSLSSYLGGLLSGQWQTALDTMDSVAARSSAITQAPSCLGPECAATASFYRAAMQRYTREDTPAAFAAWQTLSSRLNLLPSDRAAIEEELAFYALVRDVPGTLSWVDGVLPTFDSERVLELRVRRALANRDWNGVIHWIAEMPAIQQENSRWQYWLGRANGQLGNQTAAEARYQQAALDRSFYGFAAAERLGQSYQLNLERNHFDEASRQRIAQLPAVQRTEALLRIGEDGLANSEWLNAVQSGSPQQARALADYAAQQQWHARLVQTTIAAEMWDALDWRFPQAYHDSFQHWGRMTGVDPYLLMAITRRESAYNPNALSPAGARGLMQLMPGTASQVSRELGISDPGPYGVLDPELNIRLGSTYLRDKLQRYQGNRLAAAAAYNAGPGRVDQWLGDGVEAFDLFVESIPFRETRDYVQAVLSYRVIFESLANGGSSEGVSLLSDNEQQVRYDRALLARR
ncbi:MULTISPECIES: transglycosylase SLT domain-containing protein [unclassified Halomonas]|uniref:transglycosylase SLT domain-containing protein n=1 Tax=unclassified Halomonas TaxID=2609666 RepID=UPI0007D9A827|nr:MULTISPECIES: transglycosylase SLT domain-containing protein [unclassified Halomonas]MBT2787455.1 transglycosylase SLT domain-containing protein [Halomonas sp. ISL-106]MBT2796183.1 transglycosylase SLT domain-containing protein [Halomonas sp. ISL-104]OAL57660.1 lytic transglycosylase [Halomonas sp. ALS9]